MRIPNPSNLYEFWRSNILRIILASLKKVGKYW